MTKSSNVGQLLVDPRGNVLDHNTMNDVFGTSAVHWMPNLSGVLQIFTSLSRANFCKEESEN